MFLKQSESHQDCFKTFITPNNQIPKSNCSKNDLSTPPATFKTTVKDYKLGILISNFLVC